jgi:type II secretory pathway pseudopilin PulG
MKALNSTRRPAFLYGIVMWLLSFVMAGFLIQLGSSIIKDVPLSSAPILYEDFIDAQESANLRTKTSQNRAEIIQAQRTIEDLTAQRTTARNEYRSERTAFDNWIKTRTATEAQSQNPEVIERTKKLDDLNTQQREASRKVETADAALTTLERQAGDLRNQRTELRRAAQAPYDAAIRAQTLKTFLIRLAITLPLLLVSAWLILKQRQSAYWPLYRGFIFFSLFAFFVELVPYLPSYGGYLRFIVGIALVGIAGKYIIAAMRRYLKNKKQEESKTETERRKAITYETALKKMAANQCPSCDRKFATNKDQKNDFCVHCGFCLFDKCTSCDARDNSFHKFCGSCGADKKLPLPDPA